MKKILISILASVLLLAQIPSYANNSINESMVESPKTTENPEELLNRLEEIKAMDKSEMTREQKKVLRIEVKQINQKVTSNGGLYISGGAIIIILLLLIILL